MKIVGQSTLVRGTPYVHLGYLAASYVKPHAALLNAGLASLALGVAMGVSLLLGMTLKQFRALRFARRRWGVLLAGTAVFIFLGIGGLVLAKVYRVEVYANPLAVTESNAYLILNEARKRAEAGRAAPADPGELDVSPEALSDGWRTPLRLVRTLEQGAETYSVLSAGPDRRFETDDDIRVTRRHP